MVGVLVLALPGGQGPRWTAATGRLTLAEAQSPPRYLKAGAPGQVCKPLHTASKAQVKAFSKQTPKPTKAAIKAFRKQQQAAYKGCIKGAADARSQDQ